MLTPHDIAFSREGPLATKIRALKKFWNRCLYTNSLVLQSYRILPPGHNAIHSLSSISSSTQANRFDAIHLYSKCDVSAADFYIFWA
jgi:hypothetical protein